MRLAAVLGTVLWAMDASAQTQAPEPPKHWDTCLLIAGPTDTTACSDLILSDCADTEAPATCVGKMTETWVGHYVTKNLVVAMRMQMESALIGGGSGLDDTFLGEMVAVTDAVVSALHAGQNGRALALIVDTTLKRHFAQTSQ